MLDRVMSRYEGYAPLALRIAVGLIFMAHGAQKLFGVFGGYGISGTAQFFEQTGLVPGTFWAIVVGLVEFAGGLAVLLGLFTRYAAALLAVDMLVAILMVHLPNGFFLPNGFEYAFALLGASLTLVMGGAGELALDRPLARWWKGGKAHKHPTEAAA
ncbi:MAG TPA: DoxX family protein [Blastocatellia bacterium]|nr:DoxX family protein [Blastocatellia bacterium]